MNRSTALAGVLFVGAACMYLACGDDDEAAEGAVDAGTDATTDAGGDNDTGAAEDTGVDFRDVGSPVDTGTDTGPETDGGADAADDVQLVTDGGGVITDAGPGGDGAVLNCGAASCDLPAQTCCFYPLADAGSLYSACSTGQTCPSLTDAGLDAGTATALACTIQENCSAGTVCCISAPASGTIASHCVAASACASTAGAKSALLCDSTQNDAGCGDAGACSSANVGSWNLPSGFATCGGVAK
jgi:hypothetical protein